MTFLQIRETSSETRSNELEGEMPEITPRISWGNIMTTTTVIVAAATGWGVLTAKVNGLENDIAMLRGVEPRVQKLEIRAGMQDLSLSVISEDLKELKASLAEINQLILDMRTAN